MFNTSKYRSMDQGKGDSKPESHKDIFSRYGGKISSKRLAREIDNVPLSQTEREYVKQVMAKFDHYGSVGVTKEEFLNGLREMEMNSKDPIQRREVTRIREKFNRW